MRIITAPFIFMQLADLYVYTIINFAHCKTQNIVKMRIVIVKMLNNFMTLHKNYYFKVASTNLKCKLNLRKKSLKSLRSIK